MHPKPAAPLAVLENFAKSKFPGSSSMTEKPQNGQLVSNRDVHGLEIDSGPQVDFF